MYIIINISSGLFGLVICKRQSMRAGIEFDGIWELYRSDKSTYK